MVDCNPERIVFMKYMCMKFNYIPELYSRFKCASDYRYPEITQDLYFKENHFLDSIISFLGKKNFLI